MKKDEPKKLSEKEKELRRKFRNVFFRTAEGREVFAYIVEAICGWNVSMFFSDPRKLDYWMGQRSVAKRLKTLVEGEEFISENEEEQ